jgi:hypothetical protein
VAFSLSSIPTAKAASHSMVLVSDALARFTVAVEVEAVFCGAQAVIANKVVTTAKIKENRIRE